jgi:release factor glutamine methyltransferase
MRIGEALRAAAVRLNPVSDSGALDASRLLEHVTLLDRATLMLRENEPLSAQGAATFEVLVARREAGEPVAYIVGYAGFYGREFLVDARVLVPRPESEHLIEAVLADLRGRKKQSGTIVDVGTGSGALAITLACELAELSAYGTDVSIDALAVARRNAAKNAVFQRCTFLSGDLLTPIMRFGKVDAVVANLPYVPTGAIPAAPDPVSFEPRVALDGGADGLDPYRRLLAQVPAVAAAGASVFLEAAPGTIEPLATLVEAVFPRAYVEIGEDYAGLERFVAITLTDS